MPPTPGIYGWSPGEGGVHYYRIAEPLRVAKALGARTGSGQVMDNGICETHDTILVHMLWQEQQSEGWERLAKIGQHRLIFDIDDAMWAPDWKPFQDVYTPNVLARIYRNIEISHIVTTPSPFIAEHVSRYNPNVWYVPNSVPAYMLALTPSPTRTPSGRYIVGWQGSISHEPDITDGLRGQLGHFLDCYPDWDLHLWGQHPPYPNPRVHVHKWQPNLRAYHQSLAMHVGIGPVRRSDFNRGKSGLRVQEYGALGITAVVTDWDCYRDWVKDNETGLLVGPGRTTTTFAQALAYLADSPLDRVRMGHAAREEARNWTTERTITKWLEAWNSV